MTSIETVIVIIACVYVVLFYWLVRGLRPENHHGRGEIRPHRRHDGVPASQQKRHSHRRAA
jgi:hypothetical protein